MSTAEEQQDAWMDEHTEALESVLSAAVTDVVGMRPADYLSHVAWFLSLIHI